LTGIVAELTFGAYGGNMSPKFSPNSPATFSKTFDQRMKLYSIAAAATGVSVLALAQPSNAEVVITRKTIPLTPSTNGPVNVPIDLNRDGIPDFSFSLTNFQYHSRGGKIGIIPLQGGAVVGVPAERAPFYASALMRGAKIGPSAHFSSKGLTVVERTYRPYVPSQSLQYLYGQWGGNPANRFVGVRFLIKGQTHYGWVRLSVDYAHFPMSGTITAYAYETVPNKRIFVGISPASATKNIVRKQTRRSRGPSLGMLALGADGLARWIRKT
jgi:hypothetical protein